MTTATRVLLASFIFVGGLAAEVPRRLTAQRAATAPVIDGVLDDACWQGLPTATDFSIYSKADVLHPEQTRGWVCYDDATLYIALECKVNEMDKFRARLAEADGRFRYSHGGVIEIFLDTNRDRKTFQQYLVHANGASMITLFPGDELKVLNEGYLRSAASVTDDGFAVELAFPLAMLHLSPNTAGVWGFNLNRAHDLYGERHHRDGFFSSWNSTRGKPFGSAELFGELLIDADLSRFYWNVALVAEPQAGDRAVRVALQNNTGADVSGDLRLEISRMDDKRFHYGSPVRLRAGERTVVTFAHAVAAADVEARYEIALRDETGRLLFLGGTQKQDLTPADDWAAPAVGQDRLRAGCLLFRRPYIQPVLHRSVPRADELVESLSASGCPGEYVPLTVSLYPPADVRGLRLSAGDLAGPEGATLPAAAFEVRYVTHQSDWKDRRSFEAKEHLLRPLEQLDLVAGRSQRLWLTVHIPANQPSGTYTGTLGLASESGQAEVPVTLDVLPFRLAAVDDMGYFMYYTGVADTRYRTPEFLRRIVQDMRTHGMTSFSIYRGWSDHQIDVDARDAGPPNWRGNYGVSYRELVTILQEEGFGRKAPLIDMMTAWHYTPAMAARLNEIYREQGWPDVIYYVDDEIDLPDRIARARTKLERLQGHGLRFVTAMRRAGADALGHMYDVWIGPRDADLIVDAHAQGKSPWDYNCTDVYRVSPAYIRHFFGRHAWRANVKGVALWSYTDDRTFRDRFGRHYAYGEFDVFTPEMTQQYGHVCFEGDQIVPSVTWEAVREGIDDYRYLRTLQETARAAVAAEDQALVEAGRAGLHLLDELAAGTPRVVKDFRDWRAIGDIDGERARVVEAILAILEANRQARKPARP